ncbi:MULTISPECIES: DNA gyrase subunit B [Eubacterium]|jgi:DNA gyrase subunit B|uniref:DNA topoisomerase (ATP-hydrolyzing) n=1 Tax=Eubacterium album TaxID=2978477 RepID=A0ABT2M2A2_9FIRM|nr:MULTISPECIES: DNA gyrase subunit B [unclassified Eubacterium (in: firmicutes)]MCJ7966834.1 DNA gyrase subunit B [Lachnospiraceae bacterium NSJ-171]MEE0294660.1 DNA gyrase subunit B [Eubacterium sp.]CDA30050.1 dNA gyrase B subunit C-terminal domain protein [Eubacterium sp. CAG:156]MCT7398542.1 DNA gyrase subunit B [Eubacterium sp. LFL-14]RGG65473.1 DNA gyrase subunit B [Eubacterium sp. AF17-7]
MAKSNYDGNSIAVLEGLEAVRRRPGMYIGSVGTKGLNHLIYEIVDNSVDEHLAGYCNEIKVTLEKDGSATISDNGRGIPVDINDKTGRPAVEVVFTVLHAGGKFGDGGYKISGGLHGVGASVVNALSVWLEVNVKRDGKVYNQRYERGKIMYPLKEVGTCRKNDTGSTVQFYPDGEIFEKTYFKADAIKSRLHETAYLNPNLTIIFENKRVAEEEVITYHEPDGICAYVAELNKEKEKVHDVIYFKKTVDGIEMEVAFQFVNEFSENILGFCNNIYTQEGGTHLTGFKSKFTMVINQYARELGILKEKDANFTGADVRNGMTAVVAVKHPEPRFEGQTKTKLDNPDAGKVAAEITGEELVLYFDRNVEVLKNVIACAEKSAKIRKQEEKTKTNMLTKTKFSIDSNGKLANCESRKAEECEIFIVEGDSAGGSAKSARKRRTQAILPIRGKILNVEKASIDKVLANAEIKTMINAFGCGFSEGYGNDFDIEKLKFNKIILMTDADVDGAHIDTLLLTFFYRFMPELITHGHVYLATPPLYKVVPKKGKGQYLYDDKALEKYRKDHKGFTLQRYKGLGEMDADQLWETTLNPETRILKQVEIEDARLASEVTEMLMGNNVGPRRDFIYEHATDAELDI